MAPAPTARASPAVAPEWATDARTEGIRSTEIGQSGLLRSQALSHGYSTCGIERNSHLSLLLSHSKSRVGLCRANAESRCLTGRPAPDHPVQWLIHQQVKTWRRLRVAVVHRRIGQRTSHPIGSSSRSHSRRRGTYLVPGQYGIVPKPDRYSAAGSPRKDR